MRWLGLKEERFTLGDNFMFQSVTCLCCFGPMEAYNIVEKVSVSHVCHMCQSGRKREEVTGEYFLLMHPSQY